MQNRLRTPRLLPLALLALAAAASAQTDYTFKSEGLWSDPASWDGAAPSAAGSFDNLIHLGSEGTVFSTMDHPDGHRVFGLDFLDNATIDGNRIDIAAGGRVSAGYHGVSLLAPVRLDATASPTKSVTFDAGYSILLNQVSGAGKLVKTGSGNLVLYNASHTGGTDVQAGLVYAYGDSLGNGAYTVAAGARVEATGSSTFTSAYNSISGAGTLVVSDQAYVEAGAGLAIDNVTVDAAYLSMTGGSLRNVSLVYYGNLSNDTGGLLTVTGAANLYQGNVNTPVGSTTRFEGPVLGGGLAGEGTVVFDKSFSNGPATGYTSFGGDLTLTENNALSLDLRNLNPYYGYDSLEVTGLLTLGGALKVGTVSGFAPHAGDSYDLFNWGTLSGMFSSVSLPTLSSGLAWNTSALYVDGSISVQAVPEPASVAVLAIGGLGLLRRRRKG